MTKLKGVYITGGPSRPTDSWLAARRAEGIDIQAIDESADAYRSFPDREQMELVICRQGIVNDMLQYYPNVKWLQLLNAGFERVDLDLLRARGILFTNASSVYCAGIADDVMAKLLFLGRGYWKLFRLQQEHCWNEAEIPTIYGDLQDRVLGILGAGAIGRHIAQRAKAFGLSVRGYDPYLTRQEHFDVVYHDEGGLQRLLNESDFVVTSLPVTEQTKDIINARTLAMMKPAAFLINVARGQIVDETALVDALNRGIIAGAALDVTKEEPLPADDPLWTAKNILITPHCAAYGNQMPLRMRDMIARNLNNYLNGSPMENRVKL